MPRCRPISDFGFRIFHPPTQFLRKPSENSKLKTKNSKLRNGYTFDELRDRLEVGGVAAFEELEEG